MANFRMPRWPAQQESIGLSDRLSVSPAEDWSMRLKCPRITQMSSLRVSRRLAFTYLSNPCHIALATALR
jgi:hypothetical protein